MEERIYTIPLRRAYRAPRTRRAKKAIALVREFLKRHMKCENVVIGKSINESVWVRGMQKPPRKVRVHALIKEGKVYAELLGVEIKLPEKKEKETKMEERSVKEKIKEEEKGKENAQAPAEEKSEEKQSR